MRVGGQAQMLDDRVEDSRAAGMHRPAVDLVDA